MSPKISIVIPSYNGADFLKNTLDSIFSQDYKNFEVIVQDGKSTDDTLKILKQYKKKHKNRLSFASQKDKGQLDAINKGFKKAKGDVLTFINTDDVYEKGAFAKVAKYFEHNPDALWLVGKGKVIDEEEKEVARYVTAYKNLLLRVNKIQLLLMVNYIMQPSVFISRNAFKEYGPFTGSGKYVLEYGMWLKIAKEKMPSVANEYFSSFRLRKGSFSNTQAKKILREDLDIAKMNTDNFAILLLHIIHNYARLLFIQ